MYMKNSKTLSRIIFILTIITFVSCGGDDNSVTIPKQEYQKLIGDRIKPIYPKPFTLNTYGFEVWDDGIVLGSDGHEYLVTCYRCQQQNVEHYIDCVKCTERTKPQDTLNRK